VHGLYFYNLFLVSECITHGCWYMITTCLPVSSDLCIHTCFFMSSFIKKYIIFSGNLKGTVQPDWNCLKLVLMRTFSKIKGPILWNPNSLYIPNSKKCSTVFRLQVVGATRWFFSQYNNIARKAWTGNLAYVNTPGIEETLIIFVKRGFYFCSKKRKETNY